MHQLHVLVDERSVNHCHICSYLLTCSTKSGIHALGAIGLIDSCMDFFHYLQRLSDQGLRLASFLDNLTMSWIMLQLC